MKRVEGAATTSDHCPTSLVAAPSVSEEERGGKMHWQWKERGYVKR